MRLCVIPARSGSKRIPRKNIKEFYGKPMIAWSIEAAISSGCFDRIVVSTDDDEIADVAETYGADVPFMRPAVLADDYAVTTPVIAHAIQWHIDHDEKPDHACCVYATALYSTGRHQPRLGFAAKQRGKLQFFSHQLCFSNSTSHPSHG